MKKDIPPSELLKLKRDPQVNPETRVGSERKMSDIGFKNILNVLGRDPRLERVSGVKMYQNNIAVDTYVPQEIKKEFFERLSAYPDDMSLTEVMESIKTE